jgi:hypothetical protein
MRDMDVAIETIANCRLHASRYRQMGFIWYADWLLENARNAERWLVKAGKVYPARCDSQGKKRE